MICFHALQYPGRPARIAAKYCATTTEIAELRAVFADFRRSDPAAAKKEIRKASFINDLHLPLSALLSVKQAALHCMESTVNTKIKRQ
ncbi:hypothetical protein [Devosia sp. 63-57]|uniref:hypothetical protein n=1 Tax=Devosia sp. 63-57 TaxID=1895751 RepID=UPI00257B0F1F|nr:hypothetical protein [Devosia sp. 63-57]